MTEACIGYFGIRDIGLFLRDTGIFIYLFFLFIFFLGGGWGGGMTFLKKKKINK